MEKLSLNVLRERYLSFFESKGHLRLPSFSLVPDNDPSILLINAGMTPLKPYFTGAKTPPALRITTCQKCIRTPDIERVGITSRHGTFFEMLGNFSFGDYFKKESIEWAWDFFTRDLEIPAEKLYVTVFQEDDEAYGIWNKNIGLDESRISRMGKKDNFWEHGTGPCGPCSEIYFDRGEDKGCRSPECKVGCDCDRFIEVWNLVFTQFDRQEDGSYIPLEKKNIDTGMGLERLACVMQGVDSLFEVDTIRAILDTVCRMSGKTYEKDLKTDISIRIVTDHIRSTVMMISDGVIPSNEGRGYVLRRLLRRACKARQAHRHKERLSPELAKVVIRESGKAYPDLVTNRDFIDKILKTEEEKFNLTIEQGLVILKEYIDEAVKNKEAYLAGDKIFKLHDTYGFPYELTKEIAEENSLLPDREGYEREMNRQREMARKAQKAEDGTSAWDKGAGDAFKDLPETRFTGYEILEDTAKVLMTLGDEEAFSLILDKTPFYAEGGGQSADTGVISTHGFEMQVTGCSKTHEGVYIHKGKVVKGMVKAGDTVRCAVDTDKRLDTRRNHTATHILQHALRSVLGSHINQAGSYVSPDRMRFDFTHFSAMTPDEIDKVQAIVNDRILEGMKVRAEEMSILAAREKGATALFGEKYGDLVRVITIGSYSMELCGGTHLDNTASAGLFKILSESGVAAGIRRIEAVTGHNALRYYEDRDRMLKEIAREVKAPVADQAYGKVKSLMQDLKDSKKEIETLKYSNTRKGNEDIFNGREVMGTTTVIVAKADSLDINDMRNLCDKARERFEDCVIVLASFKDTLNFIAAATKPAVGRGIHCGNIIRELAAITGGGGGGRPDMAQAGGKDASKANEALDAARKLIREVLK
jgi:alanyl-tRNA synthetase